MSLVHFGVAAFMSMLYNQQQLASAWTHSGSRDVQGEPGGFATRQMLLVDGAVYVCALYLLNCVHGG